MMSVPDFVSKVMGMTFVDRARSYEQGDCWAVVWLFYRDVLGISLPAYDTQYECAGSTSGDREQIGAIMAREKMAWRKVDAPQTGDVALLRCGGRNCHVGVMIDHARFLHIDKQRGAMVESLTSPAWARRCEGVYRLA